MRKRFDTALFIYLSYRVKYLLYCNKLSSFLTTVYSTSKNIKKDYHEQQTKTFRSLLIMLIIMHFIFAGLFYLEVSYQWMQHNKLTAHSADFHVFEN